MFKVLRYYREPNAAMFEGYEYRIEAASWTPSRSSHGELIDIGEVDPVLMDLISVTNPSFVYTGPGLIPNPATQTPRPTVEFVTETQYNDYKARALAHFLTYF